MHPRLSCGRFCKKSWSVFPVLLLLSALLGATACDRAYPECGSDSDCAEWNDDESSEGYGRNQNLCIDGTCRQCRADADCEAGFECRNNACAAVMSCVAECVEPGILCRDNRHTPGCNESCPCPRGMTCGESGQCEEDGDCHLDSDCPDDYRCDNHTCRPNTGCEDRELETIYFDFDESLVRTDQEPRLDQNAICLRAYPNDEARIAGHCDDRGTDAYNLALGERRARTLRTGLVRSGIEEERLDVISYGEAQPVCRQSDESCWRQNRRAEFSWE